MIEKILCSAIWYMDLDPIYSHPSLLPKNIPVGIVITGYRHDQCIALLLALTGKRSVTSKVGKYEQGFLTNKNRFISREEAARIAFKAEQIEKELDILFSEDLY